MAYNNSLLLIVTLSSLLLSGHAYRYTGKSIWFTNPAPAPAPVPVTVTFETTDPVNGFFSGLNLNLKLDANGDDAKIKAQVDNFCNGVENPGLCAETIVPLVKGQLDPLKVLDTQMSATLNRTLEVVAEIAKLLKSQKKPVGALDVCKECYDSAVDTINESIELVKQYNVVDAYHRFGNVNSYSRTCDDTFAELEVTNPIPKEAVDDVRQHVSKTLVVLNAWVNNQNKFLV
ncbi:hypothetical protein HN51_014880 [Arachis hypogaea]|uniref:Pectinesterase inhibitor domain-containing protein n=2 Tax=Arachis TaxID=3817 RepID=A0A445CMQ0_ARAHY|nr:uncharacterized protein LOC107492289 [Arachis duranensis]XP_025703421.1 uncharacterized protein LOC112805236 [Arachis hypogaea]QHO45084.1 uncharacterized protein DS421_6g176080 [Arachis hypogaea]RYR52206.1 hypothetical protein Ahy_A06g027128 [Arachis hypogaea]